MRPTALYLKNNDLIILSDITKIFTNVWLLFSTNSIYGA